MKISLKRSSIVKAADATFNGRLGLSVLDQIGIVTHVPTIYYYRPDKKWHISNIVHTLKSSLSKVLVHFYPFAGRLRCIGGGRMELECNDDVGGVEMIEAEADVKLDDLGDFTPSPKLHQLFPSIDYKKTCIEDLPLLYVQLTKFQCGGISVSMATSHVVADGQSTLHFISEWARLARGERLGVEPIHDRNILVYPGSSGTETKFEHNEFKPPPVLINDNNGIGSETTIIALLKLTKQQVEALKNKANEHEHEHEPYSRYEVITAHMWRNACRARRLVNEQQTILGFNVDIRRRLEPSLPQGYFGNAIIHVFASATCGELVSNSLAYAANKIREAIYKVTNDYVHSTIRFLERQKDLSIFQDQGGPFYRNPNLGVISWLTLPLHDLNFGWGKEIYMSPGIHASDGDSLILPGHDHHGSVVAAVCLQEAHMEDYKNFFYTYTAD